MPAGAVNPASPKAFQLQGSMLPTAVPGRGTRQDDDAVGRVPRGDTAGLQLALN